MDVELWIQRTDSTVICGFSAAWGWGVGAPNKLIVQGSTVILSESFPKVLEYFFFKWKDIQNNYFCFLILCLKLMIFLCYAKREILSMHSFSACQYYLRTAQIYLLRLGNWHLCINDEAIKNLVISLDLITSSFLGVF